ncbi:MAG: YicC/YloC family endoribonuclease [Pseudomonadota bacterium]
MPRSMTAYASSNGSFGAFAWTWDVRGVNGKGLDLRLRVPDWIDGLEAATREAFSKAVGRGNIQISLKVTRAESAATRVNEEAVVAVLEGIKSIEEMAAQTGVSLAPTSAADILAMRAVSEAGGADDGGPEFAAAVKADIPPLIKEFVAMREAEGAALSKVVEGQIADISAQVSQARSLLPDRAAAQARTFRDGLARVMAESEIDPSKLAQELAQLAIKSDVMEEIDRLEAHVKAAQKLLKNDGLVGRKLDFLMQEFNREANTLCSKSGDTELTKIGLDLKVTIDQMREQIQNVE